MEGARKRTTFRSEKLAAYSFENMADTIICPLLEGIVDKLASPLLEKLRDLYNLRENMRKLQKILLLVQAFLEDAEKRQTTEKVIEVWLLKLKDMAYESEDLLDELSAEIMLCDSRSSITDKVRSLLLPFEPSRRLFELACDVQNNLRELEKVVTEGFTLNLTERATNNRQYEGTCRRRETGSSVIELGVYGREGDKMELLRLLLPSSKGKTMSKVSVIPIVGIGGIGKTTLARLVYNDENVTRDFDLKIWVYVSPEFDVKKLIIAIVESATRRKCKLLEMDLLESQLKESLCGKRFLLVLDDVWNEDDEEWDKLGDVLKCGMEGSKIIVTTRSENVALLMGTSTPYRLRELLEDDCLILFKKRAFPDGEEEKEYPNLLAIGRKIIKKCRGVPLAAKTLGSVLRSRRDESYWLSMEQNDIWHLKKSQTTILPALMLSYIYLSVHLKRCFVFCSLFPKNYEIKKEKLIYIWMAEGLIPQSGRNNRTLEDIADDYFNDLLSMSFFQEVEIHDAENTKVYKMHDLIHDLAQNIGGNEFAILDRDSTPFSLGQIRHLLVLWDFELSSFPNDLLKASRLRTLLFLYPGGNSGELPPSLPMKLIYLRVLDLSGCGIKRLDKSVGELSCLRYLDLSNTSIQRLPHSICNLFNLQTLNLSGCFNLLELPPGLSRLINLRHLNTLGCEGLISMPAGLGRLTCLQTLSTYIVGIETGKSIAELNCLNLKGELNIKCLENLRVAKDAKMANLKEKKHLHLLKLQWGIVNEFPKSKTMKRTASSDGKGSKFPGSAGSPRGNDRNDVEEIIKFLEPHPNIRRVFIKGYRGINFPNWFLPNVVVIELVNCRRCERLPNLGQFPFLQTLRMLGMDGVVKISDEFYNEIGLRSFQSLKELTLKDFPNLMNWSCPNDRNVFPCLQKLVVDKCPNLTSAPVFPSLEHLELRNCHPKIMNSIERMTSFSFLVIDTFPELLHLSGELLENNSSLESLEIRSCPKLQSLPSELGDLAVLKSLIINRCDELRYLPRELQKLKNLVLFDVTDCHTIKYLPAEGIEGLISLKTFSVENCSELTSLSDGICHLAALQQLSIMSCPKLDSLPENLRKLSALRSLSIVSCPGLCSLPSSLQHVTTLQSLIIHGCPGLTNLPDWFGNLSSLRSLTISNCQYLKALPDGLQQLTSIQHISIQDCPHLERLCKNNGGKEWQKIAHIPHIYIGSPEF